MQILYYLRAPNRETLAQALQAAGVTIDADYTPTQGVTIDVIGPIYRPTGTVIDDQPEMAPVPGWHANLLVPMPNIFQISVLHPFIIAEPATPERVFAGMQPNPAEPPTTDELRRAALARVNAGYTQATGILADAYPYRERESWHVQVREATDLLADENAQTPWIDAAVMKTGDDRVDFARRIEAKDQAYRTTHGALTGTRQHLESLILATDDRDELAAIEWPAQ